MSRMNFRPDSLLHIALMRRDCGASLSLSGLVRQLLKQTADKRRRYAFPPADDILAPLIRGLSCNIEWPAIVHSVRPGMAQARTVLAESGEADGQARRCMTGVMPPVSTVRRRGLPGDFPILIAPCGGQLIAERDMPQ